MKPVTSSAILLGSMATMAGLLTLLWNDPGKELLISAAAIVLIVLSLVLERLWPHDQAKRQTSGAELAGDAGSFILLFGLIDSVLKWLTPFLVLVLLPKTHGVDLALWAQVVIVSLWIEFAAWGSHWAHHRFKALWALHAMHHSTDHLYTLNNFRFHPLNHVLNSLSMMLPPILLGFSTDAVLIYTAISLPVLLLQHANVAFDNRVVNRVFNTNDLHRWHHSAKPSEGTKNLGRALVVWDHLFGTYLNPKAGGPAKIGLFQTSQNFPSPARYWAQLGWPFSKECCS